MTPQARGLKRWMKSHHFTLTRLSGEVGDAGQQIQRWASGNRKSLPWPLLLRVCNLTRIPLKDLATAEQMTMAAMIAGILKQDKAA